MGVKMDKQLMKLYNNLSKTNNKIIESGQSAVPIAAFMVKRSEKPEVIICAIPMQGNNQKVIMRDMIKKIAVKIEDMIGYIVMIDSKMTIFTKDNEPKEVMDVVLRVAYTQTEKFAQFVPYKDKVILTNKIQTMKGRQDTFDKWDVWNEGKTNEKIEEKYEEYKKQNPELYKGV